MHKLSFILMAINAEKYSKIFETSELQFIGRFDSLLGALKNKKVSGYAS